MGFFCLLAVVYCSAHVFYKQFFMSLLVYFCFFSSKESRMNGQYQQTVDVLNNDNK